MSEDYHIRVTIKAAIIDLFMHVLSAAAGAIAVYWYTESVLYVISFVAGAVLVDVDHLFDYCLYYGRKLSLKNLLASRYLKSGKVYLFLHSWELNLFVLLLALIAKSWVLLMLFLGLSVHLIIDNLQRREPFFYFLLYRSHNKFDCGILLPERTKKMTGFW